MNPVHAETKPKINQFDPSKFLNIMVKDLIPWAFLAINR